MIDKEKSSYFGQAYFASYVTAAYDVVQGQPLKTLKIYPKNMSTANNGLTIQSNSLSSYLTRSTSRASPSVTTNKCYSHLFFNPQWTPTYLRFGNPVAGLTFPVCLLSAKYWAV